MEETKDECGYLSQKEFWQLPEVIEQYKANDILNKDGGELFGLIRGHRLFLNENTPSIELFMDVYGFRKDGGIIRSNVRCTLDFNSIETYIGGVKKDNILHTILKWGGYSGIEEFDGMKTKLKYKFNDKGLLITEVDPLDHYRDEYSLKIVYTGSECNTDKYRWHEDWHNRDYTTVTGQVFEYSNPIFVDNIKSIEYGTYNTGGSCLITETMPITKKELVKILGEPIQGVSFDKVTNEWHVVMSVKQFSDIEGDDTIITNEFLFTLYDYKTYGELGDDDKYCWHIGCGWNLKDIGKKEYKSPFEKAFDKDSRGEIYNNGRPFSPASLFDIYLYNEVLKLRSNDIQG